MNNKSKSKLNDIQISPNISSNLNNKEGSLNISYDSCNEKKNEGCNDWTSVPRTHDRKESCLEHKKTATNNQWCSCNK